MKRLISNITVGEWTFDFVSNVEIISSWDLLTDTCKIQIPKGIVFKRDGKIINNIIQGDDPIFRRGDNVVVKLGYDRTLKTAFVGRLAEVIPDKPIMLMCQDDMYDLKQNSFVDEDINLKNTTLKELIDRLFQFGAAGFISNTAIADIEIGDIKVKDSTVAKVLDYLRSKLGIVSYFRANEDETTTFVSGLPYSTEDPVNFTVEKAVDSDGVITYEDQDPSINAEKTTIFRKGTNIIEDDSLVYKRKDDQRVLVIGKSKQSDNTLIEARAGDEGGDITTIKYPELNQEQLNQFVQDRLANSKYEGFEGSFMAFLEPKVRHGETVEFINNEVPEKNGVYLVKKVVTTFGYNGARQEITLDNKIGG